MFTVTSSPHTTATLSVTSRAMSADCGDGAGLLSAAAASRKTIPPPGTPKSSAGTTLSRNCATRSSTNSLVPSRPSTVCSFAPIENGTTMLNQFYHSFIFRGNVAGGVWRLYSAKSHVDDKNASVMVFEKKQQNIKAQARFGRNNRLSLSDLLKYELTQMTALVHPRILRVVHPLEENKELMAFACEHIYSSLDNVIVEETLDKLEIKLGVLQIIDGLSYLHNSAKILHGNLTPNSIYVTINGSWKIGGFAFAVAAKEPNVYPCFPWSKRLPVGLQPDLDYLAPEYLITNNQSVTSAADVFSLGILMCWIYAGGKKLIDAGNNVDTYNVIIGQLGDALNCIADQLGPNLRDMLEKVLSSTVSSRPSVQFLALIKHFDDPALHALRQLDDISQEFDPAFKTSFINQTLCTALPNIPESIWFSRILIRFNEHLTEAVDLYPALFKSLVYMLEHCESHNIHKLRPWMRRIVEYSSANKGSLSSLILDHMAIMLRRLADESVEDQLFDLIISTTTGEDIHLKQSLIRGLPAMADFIPQWFITRRLLPAFQTLTAFLRAEISRQLEFLVAVRKLSDRCDSAMLQQLLTSVEMCEVRHPAVIHSISRIVQRIVTFEAHRLNDPGMISFHLLGPLVLGVSLPELSPAHFDDLMSSIRSLLDLIEQIRFKNDESRLKRTDTRRLCNRRVSMSSNHLPRLLITATRPSVGGESLCSFRKMSFLSADGRLEDRGSRRESKESRCSIESDMSLRDSISLHCNGSDASDESGIATGRRNRRRSWLDGYLHSCSLEQTTEHAETDRKLEPMRSGRASERRARTRSPTNDLLDSKATPARPNSFTNLGHNLACTLWKTFNHG
ncbi:hypothetical protein L596_008670 [Steinernema carpocapsae]|uniref:Protein kinase domain-containing protein n=1 Tax=Steinernema carpocapsae TaxID=34508 RepID=A0A4U5PE03_STECR|nr:hypothetical protein L596_008670 [Steinernema carpocapsae]